MQHTKSAISVVLRLFGILLILGSLLVAAPAQHLYAQGDATLEANKEIVRELVEEVFNQGNIELAEEFIAPGYVEHAGSVTTTYATIEEYQQNVASTVRLK